MNNTIDYDDICLESFESNNILYNTFNINNIKLLENPIEITNDDNTYTLLKIICNKKLKIFLKRIENILNNNDNDILVSINYDIRTNKDYYELLLNKRIEQLLDKNLNINEYYNISVSLVEKVLLWKIHSIEINNENKLIKDFVEIENDINVEEFDPDYEEILNSLKKESKQIINNINSNIDKLNVDKKKIEEIFNNLDFNKIEEYRNSLDLYSNYLN